MVNLDATTPQLKAVKGFVAAYLSLDISKAVPFISKNFKFQTFPKTIDIPEETGAAHTQRFKGLLAAMTKFEVRIHHRRSAFELTD